VSGGVLIVNHQHRLDPDERAAAVYSRPEFVDALTLPVISTRQLFDWWRASDWISLREAVLANSHAESHTAKAAPDEPSGSSPRTRRLPRLRRRPKQ
jgi:hypothetical protein